MKRVREMGERCERDRDREKERQTDRETGREKAEMSTLIRTNVMSMYVREQCTESQPGSKHWVKVKVACTIT